MSGFDNGSLQAGVFAQAKQFGSILRGFGPPVPAAGVVGDLYIDTQNWFLYAKRDAESTDPWGHYLFPVPDTYQASLKWFSASLPTNDIGIDGDYCLLWGGFNNYGLQPSVCGPKASGYWPESGDGPDILLAAAYAGFTLPAGMADEGTPISFSASWQLLVAGETDEFILSIPVLQLANTSILERGLQSTPPVIDVNLNPLYTGTDEHAV